MNKSGNFISSPYRQEAAVSVLKVPANLICILWVQFTGWFFKSQDNGFYSEATSWKEKNELKANINRW